MTSAAKSLRLVETTAGPLPATVAASHAQEHVHSVLALAVPPPKPFVRAVSAVARSIGNAIPALIVVACLLLVWEMASSGPKSSLPSPSRIWLDSRDLITQPFFVNGPQDIGQGWRILT